MPVLPVTVNHKIAEYTGNEPYVCGNTDYIVSFLFTEEWDEQPVKTARFVIGKDCIDIAFKGNECPVPMIEKAMHIGVGVFAGNLWTTTGAVIPASNSIRSMHLHEIPPPTPDVYDQIMGTLNNHDNRITNLEQNGGGGGGIGSVKYDTPQSLTEPEMEQARANIGAASEKEVDAAGNEVYILKNGETVEDAPEEAKEIIDPYADNNTVDLGEFAKKEEVDELSKSIPKVFDWANAELPFTVSEISGVTSGGGFVVNPTNYADGKPYFRYNAGSSYGFRWTNPNPQKGSLTITMRGYSQYSETLSTKIVTVYTDGTDNSLTDMMYLTHGNTVTYTTDPEKTVDYIRGNYDFENWVLLDMDVLSIVADYPAPTGTVKTVNGVEPDENGNVEINIPESSGGTPTEPAENDIPKVFFGGALQQTKDEAVVSFRYISKSQDISGYAEIKAQGNSSMSYPKKNQTVKLYKDEACTEKLKVDFKGWGRQSKHCYKANWIDLTHARNVVSARLWGDVVKSRANYAELPELLRTSPNQGAVDGFPVKVYAAGVYQGRYTLNIPKDAWMANMDDELDNHCILCGENYVSGCFRALANINESDWTDEVHDVVPTSIKTRWNEVISFVMNSTDEEFKANLGNYFYVDSLLDYDLFGLASCDLDGFGKNQIFVTYDGQRWIASAYDKDSTWGLYWNGNRFVSATYTREEYEDMITGREGNLLYMRLEQLFYTELQNRWAELKNGALSIENIINRFERFTDIAPAELVKEDYASTTGGGAFTGIPSKDTNNIQQIRAFALARQAWTDKYVAGLTPEESVPCTGITLDADTLTFTSAGTKTLTATVTPDNTTDTVVWESDDTSVCTVSGGVVTAKANGNATITATCGAYSDTCAVDVSGIEEGGAEPDTTGLVYSLPEPKTFDGTSDYIDTGVKLFDEARDFTILMDVELPAGTFSANSNNVMHCMNEVSPWPGINMSPAGIADQWGIGGNKSPAAYTLMPTPNKVAIRYEQGAIKNVKYVANGVIANAVMNADTSGYVQIQQTLLIGCYQDINGNKGRFLNGTINDFKVYFRALSNDEINSYLGGVSCTGIELSASELIFTKSGNQTLTATVTPENTTDTIVWSVDDSSIATVVDGVVTAVRNGSCIITVTCGDHSATCTVTASGIAETFENASWETGMYNNSGEIEQTLNMHHTSIIPIPDDFSETGYLFGVSDGSGITYANSYLRISYFGADKNYIGYNKGFWLNNDNAYNETYAEVLPAVENAVYYAVSANTSDKNDIALSKYNRFHVAANMDDSYWLRPGCLNGLQYISGIPNGFCRSSYFDLANVSGTVNSAKSGTIYMRLCYFDESFNFLGWDKGSGIGVDNANNITAITIRTDVANAKYFNISAVANKSDISIS